MIIDDAALQLQPVWPALRSPRVPPAPPSRAPSRALRASRLPPAARPSSRPSPALLPAAVGGCWPRCERLHGVRPEPNVIMGDEPTNATQLCRAGCPPALPSPLPPTWQGDAAAKQVGEADLMMGADATLSDKTAKKRKKPDEPEPTEVRRGRVRFSFSLSVSRPAPHPSLPSRPSVPRYQYVALPVCRATSKTRYQ